MNEQVGSIAIDVVAQFDDASFHEGVSEGLEVARNKMGQFVKQHRSITQNMMRDMGSIMNSGTSSAMSVVTKNMGKAADAAGKGFTARIAAAAKSIPKSMGEAISSGAIGVVSSAGEKLGQHVTSAVAEQIQKSAPFWKKSFSAAFTQAADVNTTTALSKLAEKVKGGGDNAGKSFQDALGDRFSKAGIVASAKLGNFAAQIANKVIPGSSNAGNEGVRSLLEPFTSKLPTALKVAAGAAAGVGVLALISRMKSGGKEAVDATGAAMAAGGTAAGAKGGQGVIAGFTNAVKGVGTAAGNALQSATSAMAAAGATLGKAAASTMGDALKLGANAAGTAVAGVLGVSLTKGFNRLSAIDNAEASLRGLASTADHVPEIMDSVGKAMSGTAFGLDQGAKAAAQFAAAQVPLGDMERHLGSLANVASAAGGDFDGVAGIFSKVAAGGKVTGEVIAQLTDRGLAALPALAEELGVTTDEVQTMVSEGSISFDTFSKAMDSAMGAVAIEKASTFSGLMSNVGAAMGRFGAVMQKPFFDATKAALPGVINLFDQFKVVVEPLMQIIADRLIPYAEVLGEKLSAIKFDAPAAGASQLFGTLAALAPVLGGVAAMFAGPLLGSIPIVGTLFTGLTGPVGILAGAMVALFAVKPETLMAGFQTILGALPGMLNSLIAGLTNVLPTLAANFAANTPILVQGFMGVINQLVAAVATIAPMLIPVVVEAVTQLAGALLLAAPQLLDAGVILLSSLASGAMQSLPILIEAVPRILEGFISSLSAQLPLILESGMGLVFGIMNGIIAAIPTLVAAVPTMIDSLINGIVKMLPEIITAGVQLVNGLIGGIVRALPLLITAVVDAIPLITTSIVDAIPDLLAAGMALIDGLVSGVVTALPQIIESVVAAIPMVIKALVNALPKLIQGGIDLVLGLVTGIVNAIPKIITAVVDAIPLLISGLVEALPQLIQGGIDLVLGLIQGIIEAIPQLIVAVVAAIPQIIGGLIEAIPQLIGGGIQLILGLIQGLVQATPQIVTAVINIIPQLIAGLMTAMPELTTFFSEAWNNITTVIHDVWNGVVGFFSGIWTSITGAAEQQWNDFTAWISGLFMANVQMTQDIWNGLVSFFTGLWTNISNATQAQWNAITSWISSIFQGAVSNARNIWSGITNFFAGLWAGVKSTFNTFLTFVKTKPKEAFEGAVSAIGKVWEGIQELAKKPVRFVVETVINGLIGTINGLPGVNIPKVALPKGFARGGVLPGYMSAKRDDQLVPMRSGEGVLVPEAVRGIGAGAIHALNHAGNTGGVSAVRNLVGSGVATHPGRALGGLITPLEKDKWTMSQPFHGGHNGVDMAAASGTPILAAADGIVEMAQSVNMGGNEIYLAHKALATRYSHLNSFKATAGQAVKQGQVIGTVGSTGMSTGPHLHYMVHKPNDGGNGRGYQNIVDPTPYLGTYGQAKDGVDLFGGLVDWATGKLSKAFPEGGMFIQAAGGVMKSGVNQLVDWGKGILGMDSTGSTGGEAKVYDKGGIIPHGGTGINLSGKPEAVLTNSEMRGFQALAASVSKGGVGAAGISTDLSGGLSKGLLDSRSSVSNAATQLAGAVIYTMRTEFDIHSPSKVMQTIGKQLGAGLVKGVLGSVDQTRAATAKVTGAIRDGFTKLYDERKALQKKEADLWAQAREIDWTKNWDAAAKKAAKLQKKIDEVQKSIRGINKLTGKGTMRRDMLVDFVKTQNLKLADLAKQREKVTAKLKNAQAVLDDRVGERNDWRASVKAGITSQGDIGGARSVTAMTRNLKKRVDAAKTFNATITKLRKLGLGDASIQQLTEEFQSTGSTRSATVLLQGGKSAVSEINSLQKQLSSAAGSVANTTGKMLYQAGIDAAKGLVVGLESQQKELDKASKKIADSITNRIKKSLGIKSPSRVLAALGSFTGQGFVNGMLGQVRAVRSAAVDLSVASLPPVTSSTAAETVPVGTRSATGAVGGAAIVNITFAAGSIVVNGAGDPEAVAQQVVDRVAEMVGLGA